MLSSARKTSAASNTARSAPTVADPNRPRQRNQLGDSEPVASTPLQQLSYQQLLSIAQGGRSDEIYQNPFITHHWKAWIAAETNDFKNLKPFLDLEGERISTIKVNNETILHAAAGSGCAAACDALLTPLPCSERSELINAQNENGDTALMKACTGGFATAARCLLAHGALVDLPNSYRETPLYHACHQGSAETVRELLSYGADPFKMSSDGVTPSAIASLRGHTGVQRELQVHHRRVVFRLLMIGKLKQSAGASNKCPLSRLPVPVIRRIFRYALPPQ